MNMLHTYEYEYVRDGIRCIKNKKKSYEERTKDLIYKSQDPIYKDANNENEIVIHVPS
jgi:hypothetical protein